MRGRGSFGKTNSQKYIAYNYIKDSIIANVFKPGELISEIKLGDMIGVSRTPIREALYILQAEGFVQLVPNKGAQVIGMSKADVREIFELRRAIESLAAEKLIDKNNQFLLQLIKGTLRRQVDCKQKQDFTGFVLTDREFHLLIVRAINNGRLYRFYEDLRDHMVRLGLKAIQVAERIDGALREHDLMVTSLSNRDHDMFRHTLEQHLSITENAICSKICTH